MSNDNEGTVVPVIFATGFGFNGGSWCANIVVINQIPVSPNGPPQDHVQAVVQMPWALAKALHSALGQMIADYELREGVVSMPRSFELKKVDTSDTQRKSDPGEQQ